MRRLKSFEAARRCAGAWTRRPGRVVPIEVRRVVGSVDEVKRAALTPRFLPRRAGSQAPRYRSVLGAMRAGQALPAIEVYALGEEYYVADGHHRVAAARALGQLYLDALVHEFVLPVCSADRATRAYATHHVAKCDTGARLPADDVRSSGQAWIAYVTDGKPCQEFLDRVTTVRELLTSRGRTLAQGALAWIWGRSRSVRVRRYSRVKTRSDVPAGVAQCSDSCQ
jgi:hypothetical protein